MKCFQRNGKILENSRQQNDDPILLVSVKFTLKCIFVSMCKCVCVCVCVYSSKHTHDSGVRNKVSHTFDSRNHLIKFFVGFFYLSLSAAIKFDTKF
jgi:hypothetical protein